MIVVVTILFFTVLIASTYVVRRVLARGRSARCADSTMLSG